MHLSPSESQTLAALVEAKGRPVPVLALAFALGRDRGPIDVHAVHATVSRLRERLRPLGLAEGVNAKRGLGYLWLAPQCGEEGA